MDDIENPAALMCSGVSFGKKRGRKRRTVSGLQFETEIYVYL